MDICHRCADERGLDDKDALYGLGLPVAISGIENNRESVWVRYVCPRCRSVWDCSWALEPDDLPGLGHFQDRYIRGYEEGLTANPTRGVPFPAGPTRLFTRVPSAGKR